MIYTYTQEQRDKIIDMLLKIQINIDNTEIVKDAVKDIYKVLYSEATTRKIYNPVTGKYYNTKERSSVYDGKIKGMWKKNDTP